MGPVTTFASPTGRTAVATTTTAPLPSFVAGTQADVRGTLVAVHFRDERGFAIFSLEQPDGSRVRARGYLPPDVTLRAVPCEPSCALAAPGPNTPSMAGRSRSGP